MTRRQSASFPARLMCRVLQAPHSGYYAWIGRQPSVTELRRDELAAEIRTIHAAVKKRYGSPRTRAESVARGHPCSVNAVAKIMKGLGTRAISHRKLRVTTADSNREPSVAPHVVDRDSTALKPNEVRLTDITCVPTREGRLHMAAVEDPYSRQVAGWSMGMTVGSRLVVDALEMAVKQRFPDAGPAAHSDRGSQCAGGHHRRALAGKGITCSMSREGDCCDNAPMESFFATLKKELVHRGDYPTIDAAKGEPVRVHRSV